MSNIKLIVFAFKTKMVML